VVGRKFSFRARNLKTKRGITLASKRDTPKHRLSIARCLKVIAAVSLVTPIFAFSGGIAPSSAASVISIVTPDCGTVIFPSASAGAWVIPGTGVDAYSNGPSDEGTTTDCSSSGSTVNGINAGEEWQCVEFINRLYITNGWIDSNWPGSAGPAFFDNAPSSLSKQTDGSVSYLGPGDIVIIDVSDNGVDDGGHALVVNDSSDVTSGTVNLVSQNSGFEANTLPVVPGTLSNGSVTVGGSGSGFTYTTIGVVHAPKAVTTTTTTPAKPSPPPPASSTGVRYLTEGLRDPALVVTDGPYVFVSNQGPPVNPGQSASPGSIAEFKSSDGAFIRTISSPSYNFYSSPPIVASGGDIWALGTNNNILQIEEFSATTGALVKDLPGSSFGLDVNTVLAANATDLWLLSPPTSGKPGGSLTEINSSNGTLVRTVSNPGFDFNQFSSPIATSSRVIVANLLTSFSITEVNANNGALIRVIRQPHEDLRMQFPPVTNGTDIWIISSAGPSSGRLTEFNVATGALVRIIQQGLASPEGIAADAGHVWVSDVSSHTITELNASTGAVIRQVSEPKFFVSRGLVSNGIDVWALDSDESGGVFKIMELPVS
jgi:hypothetical protein